MRSWLVVTVVAVLFIGGIVCGVIAWPSSRPVPPSTTGSYAWVPDFHATPRPAHATTIAMDFATRFRPGTGPAGPQPPAVPFTQCAAARRGCGELIQVTGPGAPRVTADPGTGPYDGSAATLIGVVNSSSGAIRSLRITADTGVFKFAKDGACSGRFAFFKPPRGCPYGPTGYEGPGISFTGVNGSGTAGTVSFARPLTPGRTAWFSLAQALEATSVAGDSPPPSAAEQGGAPNPAEHQAACSPEPVNCATGALWQELTDFSLPGRGVPLSLSRTYVSASATASSAFGYGWTDDYAMRLRRGPAGTRTVIQEDGAAVTFTPNATGGYTAPSRVMGWLARNKDGTFTFARYGSRVQFHFDGADGKLVSETDANENLTQLTYNGDGTLQTVKDVASGRALTFFYHRDGRVSRVSGPLGHGENYGYDRYGNLTSVSNDVRDTWKFGYDPPASHLLTSVRDPRGYATEITYQGNRVAAVSDPGQGTTTWSYSGNPAAPAGGTTTERAPGQSGRPGGAVTTYEYRALELLAVTAATGTPDAATTGYTYTTGTGGARRAGRAGRLAN
jgi:YD repeat-containing protein